MTGSRMPSETIAFSPDSRGAPGPRIEVLSGGPYYLRNWIILEACYGEWWIAGQQGRPALVLALPLLRTAMAHALMCFLWQSIPGPWKKVSFYIQALCAGTTTAKASTALRFSFTP